MRLMKIGERSATGEKKIIWIDGGIHAREWISPATALYIADQVRDSCLCYSSDRRYIVNYHIEER